MIGCCDWLEERNKVPAYNFAPSSTLATQSIAYFPLRHVHALPERDVAPACLPLEGMHTAGNPVPQQEGRQPGHSEQVRAEGRTLRPVEGVAASDIVDAKLVDVVDVVDVAASCGVAAAAAAGVGSRRACAPDASALDHLRYPPPLQQHPRAAAAAEAVAAVVVTAEDGIGHPP